MNNDLEIDQNDYRSQTEFTRMKIGGVPWGNNLQMKHVNFMSSNKDNYMEPQRPPTEGFRLPVK